MTQAWSLDGQPVTRGGEPSPARCGPVTSSRWRGGERKGAPATQPDKHLPALSDLCHAQYRLPFWLAVLLTDDADAAEAWCWIALPRRTACGNARRRRTMPCRPGFTVGHQPAQSRISTS